MTLSTDATQTSPAGSYAIAVGGVSSPDYDIQFVPGTLTINPASTATTLTAVPTSVGTLQPVLLVADVAAIAPGAGSADGSVQFRDGAMVVGTSTVANGRSTIIVNGLSAGVHAMTAVYSGSGNFAGSGSAPVSVTVKSPQASTFTFIIGWTNPAAAGQAVVISAAVLPLAGGGGTPTGAVIFVVGAGLLGTVPLVNGLATITTAMAPGTHVITAYYLGSSSFAASSAPPALQTVYTGVRPASTTTIVSGSNPSLPGQPVPITATVTSTGAAPLGNVYFFSDGVYIGAAAVAPVGGSYKASLTATALSTGMHVISAMYLGPATTATSNSVPILQTVQ